MIQLDLGYATTSYLDISIIQTQSYSVYQGGLPEIHSISI